MKPRDIALAVAVAAVWGVNFVVIHAGLQHFPPLLFSALRFTFVALPAVFLVGRPGVRWYWVAAIGGSLGVLSFGLLFVGIDQGMPAGLSSPGDGPEPSRRLGSTLCRCDPPLFRRKAAQRA